VHNPLHQPIAYDGRTFPAIVDLEIAENIGLGQARRPERTPPPGTETNGEMDEALSMFWYRDLLRFKYGTKEPEYDPLWGIHVNADTLVEWTAGIATAMERDGVPNAPDLALDLAFIFGFDHCFFHHCVDAQISQHMLRLHAIGVEMPPLRQEYSIACERLHLSKNKPQWWLIVEEALANAHVARDPTRLGGLREAFIRYGILPQPNDVTRGPWALWEQVAMDDDAFDSLSHMVWLQHLTGDLDPLGILPLLEIMIEERGIDHTFNEFIESIKMATEVGNACTEIDWVGNNLGVPKMHALGGFKEGIFRRLDVPIWFHGGHGPELEKRYDTSNGEWPYGTIERLYSHFRVSEIDDGSDDPFESNDDDFELSP
jgi:hypothetical protein